MRRSFRFWPRMFVIGAAVGVVSVAVATLALLECYPWNMISGEYGKAKDLRFFSPWPMNPLVEELHDKKKKRLPRAEMQRIFQLDMKRMELLNVPILDVFVDSQVHHGAPTATWRALSFAEYPWPWLETSRPLGDGTGPQKVSYVVLPSLHGVSLQEGVMLMPGEELNFGFQLTKLRRNFRFFVIPLNPGTLRVAIGQYSWARTFADADVNHVQFLSIPVNDSTANQMRVVAASGHMFFMMGKVTQMEKSGRFPVQVAEGSSLWKPDPDLFSIRKQEEQPQASDAQKIEDSSASLQEVGSKAQEGESKSEESESDEAAPQTADAAPAAQKAPSAPGQNPVAQPTPLSGDAAKTDALDSLEVVANRQTSSPLGRTVALGYNVLLLQLDKIPREIFTDPVLMEKLAPNLSQLLASSAVFSGGVKLPSDPLKTFQQSIVSSAMPEFRYSNQELSRHLLENSSVFNTYLHMRYFGYHVVGIAPAPAYGFSPELAYGEEVPAFGERWLDTNDWNFAKKRGDLDREAQPVTGLQAIFPGKDAVLAPPLVTSDYAAMSKYFQKVSANQETFPDWKANELFLADNRQSYTASAVDYFQNWMNQNRQMRFFFHMYLDSYKAKSSPSLKDLFKVVKAKKLSGLSEEFSRGNLARIAHLDRALGQMLDVLRVRRVTHRTVLALVIPHEGQGPNAEGSFVLNIPGLKPVASEFKQKIELDDVIATVLSTVGVPADKPHEAGVPFLHAKPLEKAAEVLNKVAAVEPPPPPSESGEEPAPVLPVDPSVVVTPPVVGRFHVHIRPGKMGCTPFVWHAQSAVFGLKATHPILETSHDGRDIKFYPCAIDASLVSVSWFQDIASESGVPTQLDALSGRSLMGGAFGVSAGSQPSADLPIFLFGEKAIRLGSPAFSLARISAKELMKLFHFDEPLGEDNWRRLSLERLKLVEGEQESLDKKRTAVLFWRSHATQQKFASSAH